MSEERVIGWCEECLGPVCKADEIKGHPGVYECPGCGHPCGPDDIFAYESQET